MLSRGGTRLEIGTTEDLVELSVAEARLAATRLSNELTSPNPHHSRSNNNNNNVAMMTHSSPRPSPSARQYSPTTPHSYQNPNNNNAYHPYPAPPSQRYSGASSNSYRHGPHGSDVVSPDLPEEPYYSPAITPWSAAVSHPRGSGPETRTPPQRPSLSPPQLGRDPPSPSVRRFPTSRDRPS
ncbi:hypothetical protein ADEAN_000941200 [Angomonas deanei]|uniref:Uncharacterized protein n=1 Tax=Angomonas deanei TaxID=59799 RepID=A0A7G2CRU1_9TRYP|nr:hypothetical protein ADEAN_000941200 [Angomonas deanei]